MKQEIDRQIEREKKKIKEGEEKRERVYTFAIVQVKAEKVKSESS